MNELIKISTNENNEQVVSCRELHEKLGVNSNFTTWFKRMCEYGFEENKDFITWFPNLESEIHGGQNKIDYIIKLDMAKEICMIQRTEIGKQFRQYFIECERKLKVASLPSYQIENPIDRARRWIEEEVVRQEQAKQLAEQKPLVEYATQVSQSDNSISIGLFAKILADENIKIGQKRLFKWLRDNRYIDKENVPKQVYIDRGYFDVVPRTYTNQEGNHLYTQTLVTGKGQIYFANKLKKEYNK